MENVELTDRQRDMLAFERTWWQFDEPRADLIRARFACSADEYYAELNQVLELPGAMAHDPLVVRRFHRRRLRRRRALLEANSSPSDQPQALSPSSGSMPTAAAAAGADDEPSAGMPTGTQGGANA
jgi:hypothetical protein